ncbi:MAG: hypothetical protein MUC84_12525 [Solirubrobacteraceae bacterium]|jgi:hypothetical protein|nr:hypothetical protein [Solirubrobacteraceae bacterium]
MRAAAVLALAALAFALGGCGQRAADLFVVERSGAVPGARLTLLVGDGGTVRCNGGPEREITSADLIEARAIKRDLDGTEEEPGPAREGRALAPGPGSILRYRVRSEGGTVAFADTSRGQPQAFFALAKLTRDLAKRVCGLAR